MLGFYKYNLRQKQQFERIITFNVGETIKFALDFVFSNSNFTHIFALDAENKDIALVLDI